MILAKYISYYVAAWIASVIVCAMIPGKTRNQIASCKCGADYRIANRDLALLVLVTLPVSFPIVSWIAVATRLHKRRCLVKIVNDV